MKVQLSFFLSKAQRAGIRLTLWAVIMPAIMNFHANGRQMVDVIDVKNYGAKGDGKTDDTAAILAATADSQKTGGCLYFPAGQYLFSVPFNTLKPLHIEGAGFDWPDGSILEFTGNNQPIIQINGCDNDIENVMIEYRHFQTAAANSHSACVQINNNTCMNIVRDVAVANGAYGLYNPTQCASWQNVIDTFWVHAYSISGVDVETGGSTWTWRNIYIQNGTGPLDPQATINNYAYAGTELTLSLLPSSVPDYVREGFFVILTGMSDARLNGSYAIYKFEATSTEDKVVLHTRGALADIKEGSGKINFKQQEPVSGYPFALAGENDIQALDVELAITQKPALLHFNDGGAINITHLHIESLYSTRPTFHIINNDAPSLNIETISLGNLGFKRNTAASLIANSPEAMASIGNLHMRDVMHDHSSWVLQYPGAHVAKVHVRQINIAGTIRADAEPKFDNYGFGDVAVPSSSGAGMEN